MKILIVAAHPDDEVLGCGGIIKKYSGKHSICVLILTNGCDTRYGKEMIERLQNQARAASKLLGVEKIFFENLPNQLLDTIPLLKVTETIEKYLEMLKPEVVFSHDKGDLNRDHRVVFEATATAVRPLPGQCVKSFYTYFIPSSSDWASLSSIGSFNPNILIPIEFELDSKVEALKLYESEVRPYPHPRSPESLKIFAQYFGTISGVRFAEPFTLIRSMGLNEL